MTRDLEPLPLEPLPGDVAQLLARGSEQVEPPTHIRERLRERLATSIVGPVAFNGPSSSRWTNFRKVAAAAGRNRALVAMAGFLAGATAVLTLRSTPAILPPAPAIAPVMAASAPSAPTSVPTPAAALPATAPNLVPRAAAQSAAPIVHRRLALRHVEGQAAEVQEAVHPTPASAPTAATQVGPSGWVLEAEGAILQKGRTAMVRGDSEGALAAVEEHATRFPSGKLSEEREALKIQALVAEDRNPEARAALGAFRKTYPKSLLGPALEEAVVGRFNDGFGKSTQSTQ